MYSHEIQQYIDERNGQLNKNEILFVTDIKLHPQLNHITFNPWNLSYDMWDNLGNYYHFNIKERKENIYEN